MSNHLPLWIYFWKYFYLHKYLHQDIIIFSISTMEVRKYSSAKTIFNLLFQFLFNPTLHAETPSVIKRKKNVFLEKFLKFSAISWNWCSDQTSQQASVIQGCFTRQHNLDPRSTIIFNIVLAQLWIRDISVLKSDESFVNTEFMSDFKFLFWQLYNLEMI